jgi:uncharacterized protein
MKINIGPILKQKGLKLHETWEEPFPLPDPKFEGLVRLKFTFTNVGRSILAEGLIEGNVSLSCGKCLSDFLFPFSCQLSEQFFSALEPPNFLEEEISMEEFSIYSYGDDNMIDLLEPIRQTVILNLPMHPLCQKGCKGLCPQCGKNKNEGDCTCSAEFKDERWAVLKDIHLPPR